MRPRITFIEKAQRRFRLTQPTTDDTRLQMKERGRYSAHYGPWLVGLGAALWGTESAWRIPLNELFDAKVIVFWEHVLILIMFLPILIPRLREIPKIHDQARGVIFCSQASLARQSAQSSSPWH